jgi:ankyrin repeat protein
MPHFAGFTQLRNDVLACAKESSTLCTLLFFFLADHSIVGCDDCGCLHPAAMQGFDAILQLLLAAGCDTAAALFTGETPLMLAASNSHVAATSLLLKAGAAVHAQDHCGITALVSAASLSGSAAVCKLLLHSGADVHLAATDGTTALHSAVEEGFVEVAKLLLDAGARPAEEDENGMNSYHEAARKAEQGETAMLQLLLDHTSSGSGSSSGSSVDTCDSGVSSSSSSSVAAALNSQCVSCDCCGTATALMLCSDPAAVKLLLAAGSDASAVTSTGNTCLHVAAMHNYPAAVICLLIKAGDDLTALNHSMQTAAEVAHAQGHVLAAALLNRAARG